MRPTARISSVVIFVALVVLACSAVQAWPAPAIARQVLSGERPAARFVKLNSLRGRLRLWRCSARRAYKPLAAAFEYQTRSMCGPTSLANVLNALERGRRTPRAPRHSQFSVLRTSGKTLELVRGLAPRPDGTTPPRGFNLSELHGVLQRYRHDAAIRFVPSGAPTARVKADLIGALTARRFVVVNFDRSALGQQGGGHFSPLGAYDTRTDSFLLMDVSRKRGWSWVAADALIAAMGQQTAANRGYLITGALARAP